MVGGRSGRKRIEHVGDNDPLNFLVPHVGHREDRGIPGNISVLEGSACEPEAKLENQDAATRPALAGEDITLPNAGKAENRYSKCTSTPHREQLVSRISRREQCIISRVEKTAAAAH